MKLVWINQSNVSEDITNYVSNATWSGSVFQASRQLEASILYSPSDKNIKDLDIKLGDRLILYDQSKILINSMVYSRERTGEQGTITYSGYDELNHLLKSNLNYKFKNTTPELIANQICSMLNISVGDIVKTNVPVKKLICEGESHYNAIMKAYTKAYKTTGKKYMPYIYNKKFYMIEKGEVVSKFYLSSKLNITSSSYSETIENMVNKVKIYDDDGKQINEVKNADNISLYGIFQEVYTKEKGINAITAATNMLNGVEKTASVEAIGNISCISGYAVKIVDDITGLTGNFWISSDSHTWESGQHTMSLELTFKNIMDSQEDSE
jgi:hypothetical protein